MRSTNNNNNKKNVRFSSGKNISEDGQKFENEKITNGTWLNGLNESN